MKNKRTINENLREAASKRSRTLPSIVAASKTSLSRNFSRLPSTIDYLQESTKNLKTATKRDVKQAIDYSQGMIDWSRKGNIDLMGTSYNPTPAEVPFSFGDALVFDGVDDFCNMPEYNKNHFCISFWVKVPDFSATVYYFARAAAGTGAFFLRSQNSSTIALRNSAAYYTFVFSSNFINNAWNHFVITTDGVNGRCFWNGVESSTGEIPLTAGIRVDSIANYASSFFSAFTMDDLVMWDNVYATHQNAIDLYNGGAGVDPTTVIPNPTRWYKFNGNGNDDGSDGANLTLNNFPHNPYTPHL